MTMRTFLLSVLVLSGLVAVVPTASAQCVWADLGLCYTPEVPDRPDLPPLPPRPDPTQFLPRECHTEGDMIVCTW